MRTRSSSSNGGGNNWCPYPTVGFMPEWDMCGYVQKVTENRKMKLDYVQFNIAREGSKYYAVISISVPHDLDVLLEPGDPVHITGTTRTWSKDSGFVVELVAEHIDKWSGQLSDLRPDDDPLAD